MDCAKECEKILRERKSGIIRKVINKKILGENPSILIHHPKDNYIQHFIVQDGDNIIDPFLKGKFPIEEYKTIYKNSNEIKIV